MRSHRQERNIGRAERRGYGMAAPALAAAVTLLGIATGSAAALDEEAIARDRGWGYLIDKLVADGAPRTRVVQTFADPRMGPFAGLSFSLSPRESGALYRRFQSPTSVAEARRCRERHASAFEAAERTHSVPATVLAAIIHVESGCGRNTGSSRVFYRLARLAMASAPENVAANVDRHAGTDAAYDPGVAERTRARARYLEATFYPEVRALFEIAERKGIDPLAMHGSSSGAFGYPQFLPSSYLRHGVDANGDGRVSLYDMDDAAASCARYLAEHGWRPGLTAAERRSVIWHYNRSDAYVDTILSVARRMEGPPEMVQIARKPARHVKRSPKRTASAGSPSKKRRRL